MIKRVLIFSASVLGTLCLGLVFVVIFVNATEVNCALQPDESYTCQIRTLLLGRVPTFNRRVERVVGITVERDSCDDGCAYRAEFVTADGRQVPLSEVYTDQGPVQEQASTLGSQIDRRVDPITYTAEPTWWVLWLVGGLTAMSLLLSPLVFLRRR